MSASQWRALEPGQRSRLRVFQLATGQARTVYESSSHVFEAPNWTPDGKRLIVNQDGLIYGIDADGGSRLDRIETGPVTTANNDHVLSPDGRQLYISARDGHIHRVSLADGTVRRVTNDGGGVRHYVHGVSPDGRTLAYIGLRPRPDGSADTNVFTIPAAGGTDVQLTRSDRPHDGCEFSPDGEWIYFNSERASDRPGHAQLFRMRTDGSEVTQLTHDERVNWFPHPSPDGATLVYVSYAPGTLGHPANEQVIIRLLDAPGGEPRDLITVFGGQGTMNVPSWSPDGAAFAYVDYPGHPRA